MAGGQVDGGKQIAATQTAGIRCWVLVFGATLDFSKLWAPMALTVPFYEICANKMLQKLLKNVS